MSKKSQKKYTKKYVMDRDYKLFKYLWKWKALSTEAIARIFFSKSTSYAAYTLLMRLKKVGQTNSVQIETPGCDVWTLTNKSFNVIKSKMVELKSKGYKSENYYHDYLATALHLGEWLVKHPDGAHSFSEQQMRRIPEGLWPEWIPKSSLHRADGYSKCKMAGHNIVVAFEVEVTVKTQERYESVVAYYDSYPSISHVVWLVPSEGTMKSIRKHFQKFSVTNWSKHQFITLPEFQEKGWLAPFIEGSLKGKTPLDLLGSSDDTTMLQPRSAHNTLALLNIRKRPSTSATSKHTKTK